MQSTRRRLGRHLGLIGIAYALVAFAGAGATPSADATQEVRTIAGSGGIGFLDGPAAEATFSTPSDIVRTNDGTIYISDEASQRVRALTPGGLVKTVAGSGKAGDLGFSVPGGYRDGPAAQALFNHPLGMAVGPDGALYIADSKNACIRKLQNGAVTTVVGTPGSTVSVDGPLSQARLVSPRALAFDNRGRLWIGDFGVGLRRLDRDGMLRTIPLGKGGDEIISLSISPDRDDPTLFALTPGFVFSYHITTGVGGAIDVSAAAEGSVRPFGNPIRIVAIGRGQALFTDSESSNVRYLRLPTPPFVNEVFTRTIAGGELARGIDNAGSNDGSRANARFYSPRGLLVAANDLIIVDSGNRKLREVALPNFRLPETGLSPEYHYDDKHFEIAYLGPSVTFWDSFGDDSICATIESRLNGSGRLRRPARCHTVRIDGGTVQQIFDYAANYLSFASIDLIVIPVDPGSCVAPGFRTALQQLLGRLNKRTRLVMVWEYNYYTLSDDESLAQREFVPRFQVFPDETYPQVLSILAAVKPSLAGLPVFVYDSFNDFAAYEKTPGHLPLYENPDTHFGPRGNAFMGNHVSDFLLNDVLAK